jgi:hypothetical protein
MGRGGREGEREGEGKGREEKRTQSSRKKPVRLVEDAGEGPDITLFSWGRGRRTQSSS